MQALRDDLYRPWFVGDKGDWGFEIIDGHYKDVVVQVEDIQFSKKVENSIDFSYHIVHKPETLEEELEAEGKVSEMFVNTIELIISDILREAVKIYEETRDNDSKESGS